MTAADSSYFPGTASDCFHSFRLDSGDEAPIIMTVEPLAKEFRSAIVITGMLADAKGSDTNNEYIQFMALEEIDFAQTPYCVIACRNNKVNAKGGKGGIAGDAKFDEVEPIVEAITPVPGGVGSVTTSVLMKHVVEAAERG